MSDATMNPSVKKVVEYFRPPQAFFWKWADEGKVIEWFREGDTLCFREDVIEILKDVAHDGLPDLTLVLLVLAACRPDWGIEQGKKEYLRIMAGVMERHEKQPDNRKLLHNYTIKAFALLDKINKLPEALRTGASRAILINTIFEHETPKLSFADAQEILFEFNSGRLDKYIFREGIKPQEPAFKLAMELVAAANNKFSTTEALELKLRTGINVTPAQLPGIELPEEKPSDLLQQLSQDPKTAGLANLTQHLIAALNIPMHAQGQSDQSFGGVSDISNRGNFDRLLLSELAHDDISLMARLANNEALYLRREELPDDVNRQRIILVDTTIKMWGLPRVFAIASALACKRNNKLNAEIDAYALGGKHCTPVALDTKEGVIQTMEQLDAALHCGDALKSVMNEAPGSDRDEYFLITEIETVQTPSFQLALSELKRPLSYLIAVGRDGQLQFFEFFNGRRKLVSEAKFDLNDLLNPALKTSRSAKKLPDIHSDLPAIMQEFPFPLHFPASKIIFRPDRSVEVVWNEVLTVTADRRLLYWAHRDYGARELLSNIEDGNYCMGMDRRQPAAYVLVHNPHWSGCKIHQVHVTSGERNVLDLPLQIDTHNRVMFEKDIFYVRLGETWRTIDAKSGEINSITEPSIKFNTTVWNMARVKKIVNNGYTVLNSVHYMFVNADNELTLGSRHLRLHNNRLDILANRGLQKKAEKKVRPRTAMPVSLSFENKLVRFNRFVWSNGSEAIVDSRGLLHLRSSDKTMPEITIVLIMSSHQTAAWASDGNVCGAAYFTGISNEKNIDVTVFYNNYIQKFIDSLT